MMTPDQIRIFEHAKSLLNATFEHVILSVTFREPGIDKELDMTSFPINQEKAVAMAETILRDVKNIPEVWGAKEKAKSAPDGIHNDTKRIRDIIARAEAAADAISEAQELLGDSYRFVRSVVRNSQRP
jgi:hypothetical protein